MNVLPPHKTGLNLLVIDFETYFDSDCTLKKLNPIEYIKHPKFDVLGASIIHQSAWHIRKGFRPTDNLKAFLDKLDPSETVVLAHNTQFDGLILTQIFDFHPAYWMDSLSMARGKLRLESYSLAALAQHFGLPAKKKIESKGKYWSQLTEQERLDLIEYADHDAELCAGITQLLLPYPQDELDLIDMTIRMFVEPTLRLDTDLAKEVLENEKQNKQTLIESSGLTKTQLASNLQFAAHIQTQLGYQIPTKISPTTGKETFALSKKDPEFLEFYADADEELKALLDARLAVKSTLEETRVETFLNTQRLLGSIPVGLTYYGGHTGRWSGNFANLQNLPRSSRLRNTLIAPPGHSLVIVDSASIEARVLAWFAGQDDLVQAYRDKKDAYKKMASAIYNVPENEVTKDQRNVGKAAVLGCIAHDSLVLTPDGLVKIQDVTPEHKVWDGINWVEHQGVVFQGIKTCMKYAGLWATWDHYVFESNAKTTRFLAAKNRNKPLCKTGDGNWALYISDRHMKTGSPKDATEAKEVRTYDIIDAGPHHRFTVNDILVHNCGYGMGATKFAATAKSQGIHLPDDEYLRIISVYRSTNAKITQLWRYLDNQLPLLANGPTTSSFFHSKISNTYKCVTFDKNRIRLPNGLALQYPDLRMTDHKEWVYLQKTKLYGGAITENIIQALARIIISEQALAAQQMVGPVVLLVHDEIVCCVPDHKAETALNRLLAIMQTPPPWGTDLPIDAEGTISKFYKK